MKIIYNNIIPFRGFKAINLFGVLFVRRGCTMRKVDLNHEAIHTAQMKEMWYVGFYLAYLAEWTVHLLRLWSRKEAYRAISFEREAYAFESDADYLSARVRFAQYRMSDI